jgi:hypothetical protein
MGDEMRSADLSGGQWRGAMGGMFWPGKEAERIFGDKWDCGHAFAYLFRRFGYPEYGWDGYKELVNYYLATRMPGVALCVRPSSRASTSFGYTVRIDVERKIQYEESRPYLLWEKKFKRWAAKKYRVVVFDGMWIQPKRRLLKVAADAWARANGVGSHEDMTDWDVERFWEFKGEQFRRLVAEYGAIEPRAYRLDLMQWREFPETSVARKAMEALVEAMEELLVPTHVRDVYYNVLGRVKDADLEYRQNPEYPDDPEEIEAVAAPYSEMAGYGFRAAAKRFRSNDGRDKEKMACVTESSLGLTTLLDASVNFGMVSWSRVAGSGVPVAIMRGKYTLEDLEVVKGKFIEYLRGENIDPRDWYKDWKEPLSFTRPINL